MCLSVCSGASLDKEAIERISEHIKSAPKDKGAESASSEGDVLSLI